MSASIFDIVGLLFVGFTIGSILTGCCCLAIVFIVKKQGKGLNSIADSTAKKQKEEKGFNSFVDSLAKSYSTSKQQEKSGLGSTIPGLSNKELDYIVASAAKSYINSASKQQEKSGLGYTIPDLSNKELDSIVASVAKCFNNPSPKKEESELASTVSS